MKLPQLFYAEPRFRASSEDLAKLKGAVEWTLDTPGISFGLALDYYKVEAFATKEDRDAACGPAGHDDVSYAPITRNDLIRGEVTLDDIACGYSLGHPRFDEVITPIFDAALKRLIGDAVEATQDQAGIIASTVISIGRARYTISAERSGDWIKFPVEGMAVFEEVDNDLLSRTVDDLQGRLMLTAAPTMVGAVGN